MQEGALWACHRECLTHRPLLVCRHLQGTCLQPLRQHQQHLQLRQLLRPLPFHRGRGCRDLLGFHRHVRRRGERRARTAPTVPENVTGLLLLPRLRLRRRLVLALLVYSSAAGASNKNGAKARNFLGTFLYVNHRVASVSKGFILSYQFSAGICQPLLLFQVYSY